MATFYVRRSIGENLKPEENTLIWFSDSPIEGCNHALLLYGGNLLLLKTEKEIKREKLFELAEDYQKWIETFGTSTGSSELREAIRKSRKVNV